MAAERAGPVDGYLPIGAYGLIGDCHTAALVSDDGGIDWYCPGRFDAPAVFCRLLDAGRGGTLRLGPTGPYTVQRAYRASTAVLETTFTTREGQVRLTDFMSVEPCPDEAYGYDVRARRRLIRLVEALSGEPELELRFRPTFDYARVETRLWPVAERGAIALGDRRFLALACPGLDLESADDGGLQARFRPRPGRRQWIILQDVDDESAALRALDRPDGAAELDLTLEYWHGWSARCSYHGPCRDQVLRSAITLRLLTYDPSGAVIAAPTTSLPEAIGGVRNWDYRFTWLRDSSLMLYALLTVGYEDDAADFFEWLERVEAANPDPVPQIMYAVDGGRDLTEISLDHLEGYRGSRPVRIGNAAAKQRQLDIYGEVLGAAFLYFTHADSRRRDPAIAEADGRPTAAGWGLLRGFAERAGTVWQHPDQGIWEVRGGPRLFLYSRLRCWTALDRGIKLAQRYRLPAPLERWQTTREAIRQAILTRGFNQEVGAFTQAFEGRDLDASALVIPRIGFLPATDPRVQSTIDRIRAELMHNGLVYRYLADDGLPGGEATFVLCTYWLVDALALGGRLDEARELFEHVTRYANDLGLLAEEIDPTTGDLLGNFPQGFSHLALIGAAVNLAKATRHGAEQQSEDESERAARAGRAATTGGSAHSGRDLDQD